MELPTLYIRNHYYVSKDGWRYNDDMVKNVVALVVTSRKNPSYIRKIVIPNHVSLMMIDIGPIQMGPNYYFQNPAYKLDEATREVGLCVDYIIDEVLMQAIELSYWQMLPVQYQEPVRFGITWLDDLLAKMNIQEAATAASLANAKAEFTKFKSGMIKRVDDLQKRVDQLSASLLETIDEVRRISEGLGDLKDEVEWAAAPLYPTEQDPKKKSQRVKWAVSPPPPFYSDV